jgi:hypothetical protein
MDSEEYGGVTSSFRAYLTLSLGVTNTVTAFDVELFGELDLQQHGNAKDPSLHNTLTSPPDYGQGGGTNAGTTGATPYDRDDRNNFNWDFNTSRQRVTVPLNAGSVTWDVTGIVDEMMRAQLFPGGPQWQLGNDMGFVIVGLTNGNPIHRVPLRQDRATLDLIITNAPFNWPSSYTSSLQGEGPPPRKSAEMVWNESLGTFVMFGGVDGMGPMNDTWIALPGVGVSGPPPYGGPTPYGPQYRVRGPAPPGTIWSEIATNGVAPEPRWGHGMASLPNGGSNIVVFGGYNINNEAMNDIWVLNGNSWIEIPVNSTNDRPAPRAGMAFMEANNGIHQLLMYGGTDGEIYFNDTWALNIVGNEAYWEYIYPYGEHARAPEPRAFMAVDGPSRTIFGGRNGGLLTSKDTDDDWIEDNYEMDLGGPALGRDPSYHGLFSQFSYGASSWIGQGEMEAYSFQYLGPINDSETYRAALMDFEGVPFRYDLLHKDVPWTNTFDAALIGNTAEWYHQHGIGDPNDVRDEWEVGHPSYDSPTNFPKGAYRGRWVYGTDINGTYANGALMELYSPLVQMSIPQTNSVDSANTNGFYLVFHEWLHLGDANDIVKIDAIRPITPADIVTRASGATKPPVPILPPRSSSANTTGTWRRMIIPLDPIFNETNIYFKFTLQSDTNGIVGAGWYIDDLAVLQAGELNGVVSGWNDQTVYLLGINGQDVYRTTLSSGTGNYGFELLPSGYYRVGAVSVSTNVVSIGPGLGWNPNYGTTGPGSVAVTPVNTTTGLLNWNSMPGQTYIIEYATMTSILTANPWTQLATVVATGTTGFFVDSDLATDGVRLYRISLVIP